MKLREKFNEKLDEYVKKLNREGIDNFCVNLFTFNRSHSIISSKKKEQQTFKIN